MKSVAKKLLHQNMLDKAVSLTQTTTITICNHKEVVAPLGNTRFSLVQEGFKGKNGLYVGVSGALII